MRAQLPDFLTGRHAAPCLQTGLPDSSIIQRAEGRMIKHPSPVVLFSPAALCTQAQTRDQNDAQ